MFTYLIDETSASTAKRDQEVACVFDDTVTSLLDQVAKNYFKHDLHDNLSMYYFIV